MMNKFGDTESQLDTKLSCKHFHREIQLGIKALYDVIVASINLACSN